MTATGSQAPAFLQRLDANATKFTFQTFDDTDRKRGRMARVLHGTLDQRASTLDGLNRNRAGVFVTVNATNFKGRSADNVIRVRAVFADLDGAPLEPVLKVQ